MHGSCQLILINSSGELQVFFHYILLSFSKVNPKGLVPAITINDETPGLPESRICLELINDLSNGSIFSDSPVKNGFWRIDGEWVDRKFIPKWYGFLSNLIEADEMTKV